MSRLLTFAIVVLAVAFLAGAGIAAGTDTGVGGADEIDADGIFIDIQVDEEGDATWRVEHRIRLETDADRAGFEDLRADIEEDPASFEEPYRERMESAANAAEAATNREMSIGEVTVSTSIEEIPETHGIVTYEFTWTNFAAVDDDRMIIGNAIDGIFLDDRTVLRIGWPVGLSVDQIAPAPSEQQERSALWRGPADFGTGEPRITLSPPGPLPFDLGLLLLGMALIGAGLLLAAVAFRRGWLTRPAEEEPAGAPEPTTDVDRELLSNEEQVIQLLEENGGRMKQHAVAEELGWTAAKTSQVTGELRESGRLEGFRLGRENVLKLPDQKGPEDLPDPAGE